MKNSQWIRTEVFYDTSDPHNVGWSWRTSLMAPPNRTVRFASGPALDEIDARAAAEEAAQKLTGRAR